jgi:hypothetical protein
MSEVLLLLTSDPPYPRAGETFKVNAKLNAPAEEALSISFERHRVAVDGSGTHALCPILKGYFVEGGLPGPITLRKGEREGATTVKVSGKAENPPCPTTKGGKKPKPVAFPDQLMLTAFVSAAADPAGPLIGKAHAVITIQQP